MLSHPELIGRIAVASVLGGLIGYQRDRHGKPVGLRTHAIVAMAGATFMVVSSQFVYFQQYQPGDLVRADPSRIAAAVVSGIGFLAAGAILRTGITIQGLTTAAGLWLVTSIGIAAGAGMWIEALATTIFGGLVLALLRNIEGRSVARQRITVVTEDGPSIDAVCKAMTALGAIVVEVRRDSSRVGARHRVETIFDVQVDDALPLARLVAAIEEVPKVEHVRVDLQT